MNFELDPGNILLAVMDVVLVLVWTWRLCRTGVRQTRPAPVEAS